MNSSTLIPVESSAPTTVMSASDMLDEVLVADALACIEKEKDKLFEGTGITRTYKAMMPAVMDEKTDALDRLGMILASTQLRAAGQTCFPKEMNVFRMSPNTPVPPEISVGVGKTAKLVVANLGGDAQLGCNWVRNAPPYSFTGDMVKVDRNRFRSFRCTQASQVTLRFYSAFPLLDLESSDDQRRQLTNKQIIAVLVTCHTEFPKPTAVTNASTKRKITSAKPKAPEPKPDTSDNDDEIAVENGHVVPEEVKVNEESAPITTWTSAKDVTAAFNVQRDKLRNATGKSLAMLKGLAQERDKPINDIVTAVAWWVLGRVSGLERSLQSFSLTRPFDWFDIFNARISVDEKDADLEATLRPYVSNVLTVFTNSVGRLQNISTHHEKLHSTYQALLKKYKVPELLPQNQWPLLDGFTDECTVFHFQKAFVLLFCIRMMRFLTLSQLMSMSPKGTIDPVSDILEQYSRAKGTQQASKRRPKAKVVSDVPAEAIVSGDTDDEDDDGQVKPPPKAKRNTKKGQEAVVSKPEDVSMPPAVSSPVKRKKDPTPPSSDHEGSNDEDEEEEEKKPKKKTTKRTSRKKVKAEEDQVPPSGGKEKLAVSKTASKAPAISSSSSSALPANQGHANNDDDDDERVPMMVLPSGMVDAHAKRAEEQKKKQFEEYLALVNAAHAVIKSKDDAKIKAFDWKDYHAKMQLLRPRITKLMPFPPSTSPPIELDSKILKVNATSVLDLPPIMSHSPSVQQFYASLINAECQWDILKAGEQQLYPYESRGNYMYSGVADGQELAKSKVYVVQMQHHPLVNRLSAVAFFKDAAAHGPAAARILESSFYTEIWYTGPEAELQKLKADLARIPELGVELVDADSQSV